MIPHTNEHAHTNLLLQNLDISGLRVAEVKQFIQQLIYDDKIIPDTLFFQLLQEMRWEEVKFIYQQRWPGMKFTKKENEKEEQKSECTGKQKKTQNDYC